MSRLTLSSLFIAYSLAILSLGWVLARNACEVEESKRNALSAEDIRSFWMDSNQKFTKLKEFRNENSDLIGRLSYNPACYNSLFGPIRE